MTVSSTINKKVYQCDGAQRVFSYNFPLSQSDASDLKVYLIGPNGVTQEIVQDLTINTVTSEVTVPSNLGLSPYPSGYTLVLLRQESLLQSVDLVEGGSFSAEVLEKVFDRLTMIAQQLDEKISRAILADISSSGAVLPPIANGAILGWSNNILANLTAPSDLFATSDIQTAIDHTSLTTNPHQVTKSQVGLGNVTNNEQIPASSLSVDNTLSDDSDELVVSQKALKAYISSVINAQFEGPGYSKLLIVNNPATPDTKVNITADAVTLKSPTKTKVFYDVSILGINLAVNGANGLDTGAKANTTNYDLWLIGKEDGTIAGLWVLQGAVPTLPEGYTYSWRCGWNHTDGNGNLHRIRQVGSRAAYVITASPASPSALPCLSSGVKGTYSTTAPTWLAVSTSGFIPPTASEILIVCNNVYKNGAAAALLVAPTNSYGGQANASGNFAPAFLSATQNATIDCSITLESTDIYFTSNAAGGAVCCKGWVDTI